MAGRGAVLFDAAGTLIELREPVGETYARIAELFGVALPASRIEDAFRRVTARAPAMVFPDAPADRIPDLERDWWRQIVRATFRATDGTARFADFDGYFEMLYHTLGQPDAWRAVAGAAELLAALRAGSWATAIVSNFDRRLPGILCGLGLAPLFDAVVLASDVGAAKPAPAIFARALECLAVQASRAVVVGDDPRRDLAGARRAGLRAIDARSLATLAELLDRLDADESSEPPESAE